MYWKSLTKTRSQLIFWIESCEVYYVQKTQNDSNFGYNFKMNHSHGWLIVSNKEIVFKGSYNLNLLGNILAGDRGTLLSQNTTWLLFFHIIGNSHCNSATFSYSWVRF